MPTDLEFAIVPATDAHWNCVLKSWLRGYEQTCRSEYKYYERKHNEIHAYRERGADFLVAVPPDDNDLISGWGCGERPVIHFVYVKPPYRGQGVARALVGALLSPKAEVVAYTHRTLFSDAIQKNHPGALRLVTMG